MTGVILHLVFVPLLKLFQHFFSSLYEISFYQLKHFS